MNKTVTLKRLFAQFLATIILLLLLAAVIPVVLAMSGVAFGILTPANASLVNLQKAEKEIVEVAVFTDSLVPQEMEYVLLDKSFNLLQSDMDDNIIQMAIRYAKGEFENTSTSNRFSLVIRENEYVVIRYSLSSRYSQENLNNFLPAPETLVLVLVVLNAIVACVITTLIFAKKVSKQIEPLYEVTQQIGNQNLDFEVGTASIKELNDVLLAYGKMKEELKKSLEKQWKEEQEQREQIAALAHDLKTPLTVMYGNLDLLKESKLDAEGEVYVQNLLDNSQYMEKFITALIELSRSTSAHALQKKDTNTREFMEDLKKKILPLVATKDIKLEFLFHDYPDTLECDVVLLERAVLNVISNAVDFSPKETTIRLEGYQHDDFFHIEVTDSGPGFSKKDLEQSKQQFYMGDLSRSSRNHYGMGLTIANNIIAQHNGKLTVRNDTGELQGAQVILAIPV